MEVTFLTPLPPHDQAALHVAAGGASPAEVARRLGVEEPFALDTLYRLIERDLLEVDGESLRLTARGEDALAEGCGSARTRESASFLVNPLGREVFDAQRVPHEAPRRSDPLPPPLGDLPGTSVQAWLQNQPRWQDEVIRVTDLQTEHLEARTVTLPGRVWLDAAAQRWQRTVLGPDGQPSDRLSQLAEHGDWSAVLALHERPRGHDGSWPQFPAQALLGPDVAAAARVLLRGARRQVRVQGEDLTGQGPGPYRDLLRSRRELHLTVQLEAPNAAWRSLAGAFRNRVSLEPQATQETVLEADGVALRAAPVWVPFDGQRGLYLRAGTLGRQGR
ncbi:hypothetical protein [Deinobacterium chartae]|uniref:hypothetical protein n=1 Tax=Deinobacterium chartae TaxID=521158 RepID=UPI001611F090|nr:hypothetical protein [Deinobacterium chartae]